MNPAAQTALMSSVGYTPNTPTGSIDPVTGFANQAYVAPNNPMVNGASTVPTDTTGGTTGGTAATGNPNYGAQLGTVHSLMGQLNQLYGTLFPNYDQGVSGLRQGIDQNYADQQSGLNTQYGQAQQQMPWMMAARGGADSSDAYDAQNNAANTFNGQTADIYDARKTAENQLASQSASNLAGYHADQTNAQQINSLADQSQATDPSSSYQLGNWIAQLGNYSKTAQQANATAQNNTQLQSSLNVQAPSQVYNPQALQSQLTNLSKSSIPQFAQNQVASAAINNNTTDPSSNNYWLQNWQNLQKAQ